MLKNINQMCKPGHPLKCFNQPIKHNLLITPQKSSSSSTHRLPFIERHYLVTIMRSKQSTKNYSRPYGAIIEKVMIFRNAIRLGLRRWKHHSRWLIGSNHIAFLAIHINKDPIILVYYMFALYFTLFCYVEIT